MSSRLVSHGSRGFVAASTLFFLAVHIAILTGASRRTVVTLGLYGFVFHALFGKAYALIPSYFDRSLAVSRAPLAHLPLAVGGVLAMAGGTVGPSWLGSAGSVLWAAGALVFLATLGWTIRDNLTGAETGTGGANEHRKPVDRLANAVVPLVLGYLLLAVVALLVAAVAESPVATQQLSHVLAAGTATLLIFGVGLRLLPRFLVATPPRPLVPVVLSAGAIAPLLLGFGLFDRTLVLAGGALEAVAILGFALTYLVLFVRSDRRRVGFYSVLVAVVAGSVGAGLALAAVLAGRDPTLVTAHYRTMLLGFLGLTIVGAAYQFYPPAVGQWPFASDRTALLSIGLLTVGLGIDLVALGSSLPTVGTVGQFAGVCGAGLYVYLLGAAFSRQL